MLIGHSCINRSQTTGITFSPPLKIEPPVPPIDFAAALKREDPYWISMHIPPKDPSMNKILGHFNFVYERQACADKSVVQVWLNVVDEGTDWTMDMLGVACDQYVPPLENYYDSPMNSQGFADVAIEAVCSLVLHHLLSHICSKCPDCGSHEDAN